MYLIVDRRKKIKGENVVNKKRFLDRVEKQIRQGTSKGAKDRKIGSTGDGEYSISSDGIEEPQFIFDGKSGEWDYILPGNKEYNVGDRIRKPPGGGDGSGSEGSPDGEGQDSFRFILDYETYRNIIFKDCELPDMIKQSEKSTTAYELARCGYSNDGNPSNMSVIETSTQGLARRLALKKPKLKRIKKLEEELENETDELRRLAIEAEIIALRAKAAKVPYLDNFDRRYRNFEKKPLPKTKAVMIMLMDVSGSMTEEHKYIAKSFFVLLYAFLRQRYQEIEVAFVRHTHEASEVDEQTFFEHPETGGTVVSTGYEEVIKIIKNRYDPTDTNIYLAQASDGDNTTSDNEQSSNLLGKILDDIQYFWYIEVVQNPGYSSYSSRNTDVWQIMEATNTIKKNMDFRKIDDRKRVTEVFQELFKKKEKT